MKAILLEDAKKWLDANCENQCLRMAIFGVMQNMPTVGAERAADAGRTQ